MKCYECFWPITAEPPNMEAIGDGTPLWPKQETMEPGLVWKHMLWDIDRVIDIYIYVCIYSFWPSDGSWLASCKLRSWIGIGACLRLFSDYCISFLEIAPEKRCWLMLHSPNCGCRMPRSLKHDWIDWAWMQKHPICPMHKTRHPSLRVSCETGRDHRFAEESLLVGAPNGWGLSRCSHNEEVKEKMLSK